MLKLPEMWPFCAGSIIFVDSRREDGHGYTVEVSDLPGCVSEGSSLAEAISKVLQDSLVEIYERKKAMQNLQQ